MKEVLSRTKLMNFTGLNSLTDREDKWAGILEVRKTDALQDYVFDCDKYR